MSESLRSIRPVRRDAIFLILALLLVALYIFLANRRFDIGFPLDDAWIHQTYARNLAERGEWAFIPGKSSAASTAPLYSALLAIGHGIKLAPFLWTHLLGVLALAWAGIMAARIGEHLFPEHCHIRVASGLAVVLAWHMVWAAASCITRTTMVALILKSTITRR